MSLKLGLRSLRLETILKVTPSSFRSLLSTPSATCAYTHLVTGSLLTHADIAVYYIKLKSTFPLLLLVDVQATKS